MASSEVTVTLRAEVGPVVEALRVLITSTRTMLAALQTAVDNLEALQGVGGLSIGDTSVTDPWRCTACTSAAWISVSALGEMSATGGRRVRQCASCGRVSRDPVPTPAGGAENG